MSNIANRPLSPDELDLIESLLSLPISGDNQGIAKVSTTDFNNVTFSGGTGISETLAIAYAVAL